jgi:cystatin-C
MNRPLFILLASLWVFVAGCDRGPKVGGYAKASVTDKDVVAAAEFAIKAQSEESQPSKLELLKILRAEQQVVAGVNYRLTLKVKHGGSERTAEATVWWQAWRPNPYQLSSWDWK